MNANNGGPAFPTIETETVGSNGEYTERLYSCGGMTQRDYFAAKAMAAIISGGHPIVSEHDMERKTAVAAYAVADAMLKARGEP